MTQSDASGAASRTLLGEHDALAVLIVDPDSAAAELAASAFPKGSAITRVASGREALAMLATRAPQLVVTELDLPDADGLSFIAQARALPASKTTVLIMVVTSRGEVADKIAALQGGANAYVLKPIEPDRFWLHVQLLRRFNEVMNG